MRKLIVFFFFLIAFFLLANSRISYSYAADPQVPGVTCGNAEQAGIETCCKKIDVSLPAVPGILAAIPRVRDIIEKLNQLVMTLDRAQNTTPCVIGYPTDPADPNCTCLKESQITPTPIEAIKKMCQDYANTNEKVKCEACADTAGAWTGIGCVYGDFSRFITEELLKWGIGLAGIISLLCIIYAAIMMQTSSGNPERIKKAQELLTSCIMGLMLIIFAVFILRLIGVSILRIPGLL